jgi:hypothetical protein
MRVRFTDESKNDFVFKPPYNKHIPVDDVAFYMKGVWVRSR